MPPDSAVTPSHFTKFGELLHYLRRRAGLTQRELSLAIGYSDSHISRLEHNQRVPDRTTLLALFVPALDIVHESGWTTRLLELAAEARLAEFSLSGTSTNPNSTHYLPIQMTSFLGRKLEVARVVGLLSPASSQAPTGFERRSRLVTLTGPGGVGKTRLGIQAAASLVEVFPDGVCMIDFAQLTDPALVPHTVAASLGLREEGSRSMLANLISHLRLKTSLLLFDNCEHLIEACANLAATTLQACPNVSILATSREALKIAGETAVLVDPLPVPDLNLSLTIEELIKYDGVRLFVERAQTALPSFTLTAVNSLAVAEVCRRLDGLPLAIELAAARVDVLSVSHIASRLADTFHLLGHGSRTALPRAQTLQTCMDWSYDLLSESERLLQNRLAVFAGGWTLEAAESVCTDDRIHPHEALNLLSQLVAKSLVIVDRRPDQLRYRLLETIYQYSLEKLNSSGEITTLKDKHLDYFLRMIETTGLESNKNAIYEGLNQIEADYDNLRAALEWSLTRGVDITLSFRLLKQLGIFWKVRGFLDEGRLILSAFLARPDASDMTVERAWLLCQHAVLAGLQSDVRAALPLLEESRAIYKQLQPAGTNGEVEVLINLGVLEVDSGEAKIALEHAQNALAIAVEIDYLRGVRSAHHVLGVAFGHLGQYEQAAEHLEASLELDRKMGGLMNITLILNLGELAVRQGDYAKAKALLQDGLIKAIEAKDKWEIGANLGTQAWIALLLGEFEQARQLLGESLAVRQEIGDNGGIAWCLEKLAELADLQGSPGIALRLMGKAASLRLMSNSQVNSADRPDYNRFMSSLRERIEPGAFASAWETGASMPLDSAIHLVL